MSWSRVIVAAALAGQLAACGFQPLYGRQDAVTVPDEFAAIFIARIEERVGQELRNHLVNTLQPRGRVGDPLYRLEITVSEGRTSLGVRKSAFATRAALRVNASVRLYSTKTRTRVLGFNSVVRASFNIFKSEFATLMAEKDARSKAIRDITEDIRLRVGAYLKEPTRVQGS